MDLGLTLPTSGPHASPEAVLRLAVEAERLGYAAVWTYERLLYPLADVPQPGGPPRPMPDHYRSTYEPIETLAWVAARTGRIALGTSVLGALFHVPVVLARRLATLDRLSGGRVIAGLGQGWVEPDFAAAGVPMARRGAGFEEFVAALRAAWGPDPVTFDGRFYRIPPSLVAPKPVQEKLPVMIGALAPAAIDRAGRIADGLNSIAFSAEALAGVVRRFRRAATEAGRDAAALTVVVRANVPITADDLTDRRPFLGGSPRQIAEDLRSIEHLSVDQVMFTNLRQPPIDEQVELAGQLITAHRSSSRKKTVEIKPGRVLSQILLGNRVQQAVYVAAKLGVADIMAEGPQTAEELAAASGAHADSLHRLLRMLASSGVFIEDEDGQFGLTPVGELLRSGTPQSKRAFALWSGGISYQLFGMLLQSVLTGRPAFDDAYGMEFFEYLEKHRDVGDLFDEFMSRQTAPMGPVLAAYDLSGVGTLVDVAGGRGELLAAVLAAHPEMRGVLVDRERALEGAAAVLAAKGVAGRCETVRGDYLEQVPAGGDAYLLKNIVHGLDDERATRVLANCRAAMNSGGRVLLVEFVIRSGNDPSPGKLMDLLMLVGSHGGRERTEPEFAALLAAARFGAPVITTTRYGYSVIEARTLAA